MADPVTVFDRRIVRQHRNRAAARIDDHDFLSREIAERLVDRLDDIRREFPEALELGIRGGARAGLLHGRGGVARVVQTDLSPAMVRRVAPPAVVADEEALPFADGTFDLVLSSFALHWVNDLPGALVQIRRTLKPDGLFLAAMLGGDTLRELRESFLEAELLEQSGASPRVSPFADMQDAGGLLQRAGFALPVVDLDTITVTYGDAFALMRDLRGMGETGAVLARCKTFSRRATMFRAAAIYRERFGDASGRIPATFQVLFATAWAPHESQQKPLRPGKAQGRLADALDTAEISAGDKAKP